MPPGGFRLAVINSFDLEAALALREIMARDFGLEERVCPETCALGAPAQAGDSRSACG
jgi:hypothetical protein